MGLIARIVANAVGLWVATALLPGLHMAESSSLGHQALSFLLLGIMFSVVNMIVRPIVAMISLPLYIVTLGLFFLVVNALMLMLTGWISSGTSFALQVDGFGWALLGGIVVALASMVVEAILPSGRSRERD